MSGRVFHVALFGATGFTGRLAADYLLRHGPADLALLLVGRDRKKLEGVAEGLPKAGRKVELATAEVSDPASLLAMAEKAQVVLTTVGPYQQFGEPVVLACIQAGSDYVDLTGEPAFVDKMIVVHGAAAKAAGVRIVNCCGFDSVPPDLGVYTTVKRLPEGVPITIEGFVRAKGGISGGTFQSAIGAFGDTSGSKRLRAARRAAEPSSPGRVVGSAHPKLHRDERVGAWAVPFPTIDQDVVLRSAQALDRYGPEFRYAHYFCFSRTSTLLKIGLGLGAAVGLSQLQATRSLLGRFRASGEGPAPEERAKSKFELRFFGQGGGKQVETRITGGDPGYDETAKMISECALCLAYDREKLKPNYGVITPAVAMGDALVERLARAGLVFEAIS